MPLYIYTNELTGKTVEIYQGMNELHEYTENGIKFTRVWTKPQASSSTKLDPFDKAGFIRQLDNKHGETIGDTMDRATELSHKRADKMGEDPIRRKYYDDFSKKHRGKQHPNEIKEKCAPQVAKLKELGVSVRL